MILSNFFLLVTLKQNFHEKYVPKFSLLSTYFNSNNNSKGWRTTGYSKLLVAKSKSFKDNSLIEFNRGTLVTRNIWQKLINTYLQETIFLSPSNHESVKYINKVKSLGISVYQGVEYKNFVNNFIKSLISDSIQVQKSSNLSKSLYKNINYSFLKYKWIKFFNPQISNFRFINYCSNFARHINLSLPIFIVVNDQHEVIVSESTDQLSKSTMLLNCYRYFKKLHGTSKRLYTGLIFINPKDALEYKRYIEYYSGKSTHSISLKVVSANINAYYKFMFLNNNNIEFRLVPDLMEVSNLVYKNRKKSNLVFSSNQRYGSNYFQGQPIYSLKPFDHKLNDQNMSSDNDASAFNSYNKFINHQVFFLNYETLLDSWKKFAKQNVVKKTHPRPKVYVYNLESFIKHSEHQNNFSQTIFVPSLQTYEFTNSYLANNSSKQPYVINLLFDKLFYCKSIFYRIFWSLTTRQPINI